MMASTAHAEPPGLTPIAAPAVPETVTEELPSYRWETALADTATIVVGIAASKSNASGVFVAGYLLGGPLVHLANDHAGRAATSLGLRLGLPLLGLLVGAEIGHSQCDADCDNDADIALAALGTLTGMIAASAIDIGYLSRGETITHTSPSFGPTLSTGPNNSVRLGIGGTF
jgi:hypothetical protein